MSLVASQASNNIGESKNPRAIRHRGFFVFGAGNETRTRDPDLGKVVLYQLSYSRLSVGAHSRHRPQHCQYTLGSLARLFQLLGQLLNDPRELIHAIR